MYEVVIVSGDALGHGTCTSYEFTLHGSHGQLSSADFTQAECSAVPLLAGGVSEGYAGLLKQLTRKLAPGCSNGSSTAAPGAAGPAATSTAADSSESSTSPSRTTASAALQHAASTGKESGAVGGTALLASAAPAKSRSICAEFGAWVERHGGMGQLSTLLSKVDTSRDSKLDANELLQLLAQAMPDASAVEAQLFLAMSDVNGDGQLSLQELEEAVRECSSVEEAVGSGALAETSLAASLTARAPTTQAGLLPQLITQLRSNGLQLQQQLEASDPDGTGYVGVQSLGQALLRCLPGVPPQQLRMLLVHVGRTVLVGPGDPGLPMQAVLQSLSLGGQSNIQGAAFAAGWVPGYPRDVFRLLRFHVKKNRAQLDVLFPADAALGLAQLRLLLQALLESRAGEPPLSGRELCHAMAVLDANSNGQVTRQEFEDGLRDCRDLRAAIMRFQAAPTAAPDTEPLAPALANTPTWGDLHSCLAKLAAALSGSALDQQVAQLSSRGSGLLDHMEAKQLLSSLSPGMSLPLLRAVLSHLDLWDPSQHAVLTVQQLTAALQLKPAPASLMQPPVTVSTQKDTAAALLNTHTESSNQTSNDKGNEGLQPGQQLPMQWLGLQCGDSAALQCSIARLEAQLAATAAASKSSAAPHHQPPSCSGVRQLDSQARAALAGVAARQSAALGGGGKQLPTHEDWQAWHSNVQLPGRSNASLRSGGSQVLLPAREPGVWWGAQQHHTAAWLQGLQRQQLAAMQALAASGTDDASSANCLRLVGRQQQQQQQQQHASASTAEDAQPGLLIASAHAVLFTAKDKHLRSIGNIEWVEIKSGSAFGSCGGCHLAFVQVMQLTEGKGPRDMPLLWQLHHGQTLQPGSAVMLPPDPCCWQQWLLPAFEQEASSSGGAVNVAAVAVPGVHYYNSNLQRWSWSAPLPSAVPAMPGAELLDAKAKRNSIFGLAIPITSGSTAPPDTPSCSIVYLNSLPAFTTHPHLCHSSSDHQPAVVMGEQCAHGISMRARGGFAQVAGIASAASALATVGSSQPSQGPPAQAPMECTVVSYALRPTQAATASGTMPKAAVLAAPATALADAQAAAAVQDACYFVSSLGLDDSAGVPLCPVRFSVMADEVLVWQSGWITHADEQDMCKVGIRGVSTLRLVVESSFSAGAHAVWVDPHLICGTALPEDVVQELGPDTPPQGVKMQLVQVPDTGSTFIVPADTTEGQQVERPKSGYRVTLVTSDVLRGGSSGTVSARLKGYHDVAPLLQEATSSWTVLTAGTRLERGSSTTCDIQLEDIGSVSELHLQHTGASASADWHLHSASVLSLADGVTRHFMAGDWTSKLARPLDGVIVLQSSSSSSYYKVGVHMLSSKNQCGSGVDGALSLKVFPGTPYTAATVTSSDQHTAAQQPPSEGRRGELFDIPVPGVGQAYFSATVKSCTLAAGLPAMLELLCSQPGILASRLQCVEVTDLCSGQHTLFLPSPAARTAAANAASITLHPTPAPHLRIAAFTSNLPDAGTDANVFLDIHGSSGSVLGIHLRGTGDVFSTGREDVFFMPSPGIGRLNGLRVWHDGAGDSSNWHLDRIEVTDLASGAHFIFPCNAWLAHDTESTCSEHCLRPLGSTLVAADGSAAQPVSCHVVLQAAPSANSSTCTGAKGLYVQADSLQLVGQLQDGSTASISHVPQAPDAASSSSGDCGSSGHVDWLADDAYLMALRQQLQEQPGSLGLADTASGATSAILGPDTSYQISVDAAEVLAPGGVASTAAAGGQRQLHVVLHGTVDSSGLLSLCAANSLGSGQLFAVDGSGMEHFQVQCPYVGTLLRVDLCMPCNATWGVHVRSVSISAGHTGSTSRFCSPSGCWLGCRPQLQQQYGAACTSVQGSAAIRLLPEGTTVCTFASRDIGTIKAVHVRCDHPAKDAAAAHSAHVHLQPGSSITHFTAPSKGSKAWPPFPPAFIQHLISSEAAKAGETASMWFTPPVALPESMVKAAGGGQQLGSGTWQAREDGLDDPSAEADEGGQLEAVAGVDLGSSIRLQQELDDYQAGRGSVYGVLLAELKEAPPQLLQQVLTQLKADQGQGLSPAQLGALPKLLMPQLALSTAALDSFVTMLLLPGLQQQHQALTAEQLLPALRSCRDAVKQATAMQRLAEAGQRPDPDVLLGGAESALCSLAATLVAESNSQTAQAAFRALDGDGSGYVETRELCAVLKQLQPGLAAGEARLLLAYLDQAGDTDVDGKLSHAELRSCLAPFVPVPSAAQLAADAEAYHSRRISVFALLRAAMVLQPALLPALFIQAASTASLIATGSSCDRAAGMAIAAAVATPSTTGTAAETAPNGHTAAATKGAVPADGTAVGAKPSTNSTNGTSASSSAGKPDEAPAQAAAGPECGQASTSGLPAEAPARQAFRVPISAGPGMLQDLVPSVDLAASDIMHAMSMLQLDNVSSSSSSNSSSSSGSREQCISAGQLDTAMRLGLDASKRAAALQRAVDAASASSSGSSAIASKCALDPELGGAELIMCKLSELFASKKAAKKAAATFAQFDTDGSGFLEPRELCCALRAIVPAITPEEQRLVLAYLHSHDTNRDGSYSLHELQAAAAPFCLADDGDVPAQ